MPLGDNLLFPGFLAISRIRAEGQARCSARQGCRKESVDNATSRKPQVASNEKLSDIYGEDAASGRGLHFLLGHQIRAECDGH